MTRRTPRILMSVAAAGMAGGLVVATAAPAVADTADLWGSNARWLSVSSTSPYIGDAESAYRDLLGSGVDLPFGWTGDVFDGALYGWTLSDGASTASITWTAAGEVVDPTGVSTWNYSGASAAFPGATFAASLEIQGSTARWTVTPTSAATGLEISANANLGSDNNETFTVVTPNSAVVSSDNALRDPVLGYWFSAPSGALTPGFGDVRFSFVDSGPATIVIAVQDYAVCAQQTAVDEMVALVPTLGSQFGLTIDGALGCLTSAAPTTLSTDEATTQVLDLAVDPAVDAFLTSGVKPFTLDTGANTYFADPALIGSAVVGLPDGLTGVVDATTQQLTLSGTPTESGTFEASVILYRLDVRDYAFGVRGNGIPLVAPLTVTVEAPAAPGAPAAPAELPATGPSDATLPGMLAAGFLVAGAVALAAARTRRA